MNHQDIQEFKDWQREWSRIRTEYLTSRTAPPAVYQTTSNPHDGYTWHCPKCGEPGRADTYEKAETYGMNHLLSHTSPLFESELEVMKLEQMPEKFMTDSQKRRKALIEKEGRGRVKDAIASLYRAGIKK